MAGHDDVYALLPSGYTILFGSNPQEAADLAAIAYRSSALSLIPVANAMDEAMAMAEASRCLECGVCSECYQCVSACLADAVDHDQTGPGADDRHDLGGEVGVGEAFGRDEDEVDHVAVESVDAGM